MGRPRKPTAQKRYEGNPGRRELLDDDFTPGGVPIRPKGFDAHESWCWDLVIDELVTQNIATEVDTPMLIEMCWWWSQFMQIRAEIDEEGLTYKRGILASVCSNKFNEIASKFGLNPSARAGLKLNANKSQHSPLDDFLKPHVPCRTN
jgi:phage terminase small subunit